MAYKDNQSASVTSVAGTKTTITTINVPAGQQWLVQDLWCGGDTGTYSLDIDVYPQANFSYIMNSSVNGSMSQGTGDTSEHKTSIPLVGPAQIIASVTGVAGAACDFSIGYTSSGGPTN